MWILSEDLSALVVAGFFLFITLAAILLWGKVLVLAIRTRHPIEAYREVFSTEPEPEPMTEAERHRFYENMG